MLSSSFFCNIHEQVDDDVSTRVTNRMPCCWCISETTLTNLMVDVYVLAMLFVFLYIPIVFTVAGIDAFDYYYNRRRESPHRSHAERVCKLLYYNCVLIYSWFPE